MRVTDKQINTLEDLQHQLALMEEQVSGDSQTVLEQIGEQLADWERIVRENAACSLALRIGELLVSAKQYWLALSWFQWVLSASSGDVDPFSRAKALRHKGRICILLDMTDASLPYLKQAEALLSAHGYKETREYCMVMQNLSIAYVTAGQFEQALAAAQVALPGLIELEDHNMAGIVAATIGSCLRNLKQYEEALEHYTQAREWLELAQDTFHLARVWHNYAELMRDWGRMEEAIAAWRMSLEMKKRNRDNVGQVNTLLSMADYLTSREELHAAWQYVSQAIAVCHLHNLREEEIICLDRWSGILIELGRFADLEICAARAAHLAQEGSGRKRVLDMLRHIAEQCQKSGLEQQAAQYNMIAVQIID